MPSKYCGKLPRCKNSWWCATDFRPSENAECFTAMTNYDRIISKTPEELAEWVAEQSTAPNCTGKCHKDYEVYGELRTFCHDCWLDWMRKEVNE